MRHIITGNIFCWALQIKRQLCPGRWHRCAHGTLSIHPCTTQTLFLFPLVFLCLSPPTLLTPRLCACLFRRREQTAAWKPKSTVNTRMNASHQTPRVVICVRVKFKGSELQNTASPLGVRGWGTEPLIHAGLSGSPGMDGFQLSPELISAAALPRCLPGFERALCLFPATLILREPLSKFSTLKLPTRQHYSCQYKYNKSQQESGQTPYTEQRLRRDVIS